MKNGFTLIELLAVIVILAIIALIATPIVLSIIDDSKESSMIRSAEGYLRAVEYEVAQAYVTANRITEGTYYVLPGGDICIDGYENNECTGNILEIEYNNEGPISGSITFEDTKIVHYTLTYPSGITVVDGKVDDGEAIIQLAPGLYDENDNLLISWTDLTSLDYKSFTYVNHNGDEITSPILRVDENGVLYTAHYYDGMDNYSTGYLNGKLVIDDSVKAIDSFVFCSNLTNIIIPNSVTKIDSYAFEETSIESIVIPASLTSIGYGLFYYNEVLSSIKVDENNPVYDSRDDSNAIIETATNTLIVGSNNTIIPDSITSIADYAFYGRDLTSITIPKSVTSIGEFAFANCIGLTINYAGTESEWDVIEKTGDWNYDSEIEINYNYTGV